MKRLIFSLAMLLTMTMSISAQDLLGDLPQLTSPKNVKVTDVGKCTLYAAEVLVEDSLTGRQDTVYQSVPDVVWQSEGADIYQSERPSRRALSATKLTGSLNTFFANLTFYVFKFTYESIDSEGKPVTLSGIAAAPDPKLSSEVNNMLIGTHITITSDAERPSNQTTKLESTDWGILFSMAAGKPTEKATGVKVGGAVLNTVLNTATLGLWGVAKSTVDVVRIIKYDECRRNFVVMPDYEGYGVTVNRAHPYLYQELTARQVADAARAAYYAYHNDAGLKDIHLKFRKDWKTVVCGYSQGGSVAMVTQRFMEQNHIDDEFHLAGSICGDGPYDPMSTLMYYVKCDKEDKSMSMPVVLPLIVKGMLDTNPYMRAHKAADYFNPKFIETGILDWIGQKKKTTGDIENAFKDCYYNGKNGDKTYFRDILEPNGSAKMRNIMNKECLDYFTNIYDKYKDKYKTAEGIPLPEKRGVMEDLHMALASNDLTNGWEPKHHILLFHSNADTTVPYDNAERAKAKLGDWAVLHTANLKHDHVDSGKDFFAGDDNGKILVNDNLRITFAIKALVDLPYQGQTKGAIKEW